MSLDYDRSYIWYKMARKTANKENITKNKKFPARMSPESRNPDEPRVRGGHSQDSLNLSGTVTISTELSALAEASMVPVGLKRKVVAGNS